MACKLNTSDFEASDIVGEGLLTAELRDHHLKNNFTEIIEEEHESESNID